MLSNALLKESKMAEFKVHDRRPSPKLAPGQDKLAEMIKAGPLPFKPGTVLHASESQDLKVLGWEEGDPIPANFAKEVAKEKELAAADFKAEVNKLTKLPNLKLPPETRIGDLPREHQQRLSKALQDYKEMLPQLKKSQESQAALPPHIAQAVAQIQSAVEEPVVKEENKEETNPEKHEHCPRCFWDVKQKNVAEPDMIDKMVFTAAILGGLPFKKDYSFLNGKLVAAFRSASTSAMSLLSDQISHDMKNGKIGSIDDALRLGHNYRLAISLDYIACDGQVTKIAPGVDEALSQPTDGNETQLPRIVEQLKETSPLNNEFTWDLLLGAVTRFIAIGRTLQDRAHKPDFSIATEA
jgi:hypothetical protein